MMKNSGDPTSKDQITANLKAAGQLVKKQALRTKLATVDLPKALVSLGKFVYGLPDSKNRFGEQYRLVDEIRKKLEDLATSAKSRPVADSVSGKAQGLLKGAGDLAQRKLLETQLSSALSRLGDAASSHAVAGAEPFLKIVSDLRSQIAELDAESSALSQMAPAGGWLSPKRILLGSGVLAAVLVAAFVLKPSGTGVKENPYADDERELSELGDKQLATIKQADALWEKKNLDGAAALYAQVIEVETKTLGGTKARDSLPQPAGRLIDHIAGKGGTAAAADYALKALNIRTTPLVMTDAGSRALDAAKQQYAADDERRDREMRESRQESEQASASSTSQGASRGSSDEEAYQEGYNFVSGRLAQVRSAPPAMKRSLMQAMQQAVLSQKGSKPRAFFKGAADAMEADLVSAAQGQ